MPTQAAAFVSKKVVIDGSAVEVAVWDTAGQERFHALGMFDAEQPVPSASDAVLMARHGWRHHLQHLCKFHSFSHAGPIYYRNSSAQELSIYCSIAMHPCVAGAPHARLQSSQGRRPRACPLADAAILVFDVTDADSFRRVRNWVAELRQMVCSECACRFMHDTSSRSQICKL